ncbi:MAG: hypothetical protein LC118_17275 [Dehalococcoidia bacterium]|nr:hypothetical protein [Dehalococcoidia bacterium]
MGEKEGGQAGESQARDVATGIATGRDAPGASPQQTVEPRETHSGLPTGRAPAAGQVSESPMPSYRDHGTGQATGIAIGDPGVNSNFTEPSSIAVSDEGTPGQKPAKPKTR